MTQTIRISGHSDDIVSIDGDVNEEFAGGDEPRFVVLYPTRDVFKVTYGDPTNPSRGVWSVEHHFVTGHLTVRIERAPDGDDPDPYTDVAHVTGHVDDVRAWPCWPVTEEALAESFDAMVENDDLTERCKAKCWRALRGEP